MVYDAPGLSLTGLILFAVKVVEKTADELELEEFLFGKDIINDKSHKEEEEIEVFFLPFRFACS